jgi:uncharacterized glyoxalase superfamily protein PhnB
MAVKPIPDGWHVVTPYLLVPDTQAQIEFIVDGLGGREIMAMRTPDGAPMHAETELGDSKIMMGLASEQFRAMPSMLYVYVEDVDAVYRQALDIGGESLQEPKDQSYGDRTAAVKDVNGNHWYLATHIEDLSDEELHRRSDEAMKEGG